MLGFHVRCANIRSPAGHSRCAIVNLHWHQFLPAGVDGTLTPSNVFKQRIGGIILHKCLIANKDDRQHDGMMIYEVLLPITSVLMTGLIAVYQLFCLFQALECQKPYIKSWKLFINLGSYI